MERVNSQCINCQCREGQQSMERGSTVNVERINSQLSLSHEKAITSVDLGAGRSMIDTEKIKSMQERINSQLALPQEKVIASVDGGGGGGGRPLRRVGH